MAVSKDEVERIAVLARLRLEGADAERLARDLSSVLGHMETLAEADVSAVEAVGDMTEGPAPFRAPDEEADPLRSSPKSMAPDWRDDFFVVPRLPGVDGGEGEGSA